MCNLIWQMIKGSANRLTMEEIIEGRDEPESEDDDPDGDWVKTSYIYDITLPYYEVLQETTNGKTTLYDYGIERIAAHDSAFLGSYKTSYVYDGRGSVAQEVGYNNSWYTFGGILSPTDILSRSYTPFGEQLREKVSGYGFNGEYYDSATGMLNLRARQYEPAMNRFSQKDILKGDASSPASMNRYLFVENDPVNFSDPSGMFLDTLWNGVKKAASTAVQWVSNTFSSGVKLASQAAGAVVGLFNKDAGQRITNAGSTAANKIQSLGKKISNNIYPTAAGLGAKRQASNIRSKPLL